MSGKFKALLGNLFSGAQLFQVFIGIPAAAALWYYWPMLAHKFDPGAPTLGLEYLEPMVVAALYLMAGSPWAFIGAKLLDGHFPEKIAGCDTSFLLYCSFLLGYLAIAISLLASSSAPLPR
jgi:hypothetical protein